MSVSFADIHAMIKARNPLPSAVNCNGTLTAVVKRLQQSCAPTLKHPRAAFYASGYAEKNISQTRTTLESLSKPGGVLQQFCGKLNADLRVYELDMNPLAAIDEKAAAHIIAYGLMAVEEHVDCLIVGSVSDGFHDALQKTVQALQTQKETDVLAIAAQHGGQDLCALIGACLAARMALIPVVAGYETGNALALIMARLVGDDTTLIVAPQSAADNNTQALLTVYQGIGLLLADLPEESCGMTADHAASKRACCA